MGCLTLAGRLAAEGNSSLTESKNENADAKVTAAELLSQNEALRRELSLARESVRTLTDSLAESNLQAEVFRRKYSDLELRMDALGLESADKDRAKLEQRLLSAVSDLQLLQKEREQYTATLMDGSVISVKDEWSLVVGNIGEKQGVKMGMPMRVMRGDKVIATLRVVDVRQRICGAVIQKMDSEKEKIKVGDRLQADARKDVSLK